LDVFATIADITDNGLPEDKNVAPDSHSFLPALMEKDNNNPRTTVVTANMHGMQAIRMGDWKLIDNTLPSGFPEERKKMINMPLKKHLFNLTDDPAESKDLIDKNPEIAEELLMELNKIRNTNSTRD